MRKQSMKWNKYLAAGLFMTGFALLLGIVGIFWTPYSTTAMSAAEKFNAPSLRHIFGTDNFGRDIFSRVMEGMGTTVVISSLVVLFSGSAGILLGALTGYFGGVLDEVVMRVTDAVNGFPSILLTLVIISILGSGKQNVIYTSAGCGLYQESQTDGSGQDAHFVCAHSSEYFFGILGLGNDRI